MSKIKEIIPRPFRRGRCTKCHKDELKNKLLLCQKCEAFAGQDYKSRKFEVIDPKELKKASDKLALEQSQAEHEEENSLEINTQNRLQYIFRKSGLTRRQRQVMRRFFVHGEDFYKISASLGISKTSAATHMCRAIENLKKCRKPALLMRGTEFSGDDRIKSDLPVLFRPKKRRLRSFNLESLKELRGQVNYQPRSRARRIIFGRVCPRCKDRIFTADRNYLYCMNCFWNSDQEN